MSNRNCPACWGRGRTHYAGWAEPGKDPRVRDLLYGTPCPECGGTGTEPPPAAVVPRPRVWCLVSGVSLDEAVALLTVALAAALGLAILTLIWLTV